jgi:hypothetical protein
VFDPPTPNTTKRPATTPPKAITSTRAANNIIGAVILSEASGCLEIAVIAFPPIKPIPIPAPIAAKPVPITAKPTSNNKKLRFYTEHKKETSLFFMSKDNHSDEDFEGNTKLDIKPKTKIFIAMIIFTHKK